LVDFFIARYNEKNLKTVEGISREALDRLMVHHFPGNIRELENIIERAVIFCRGRQLHSSDISLSHSVDSEKNEFGEDSSPEDYDGQIRRLEKRLIESSLELAQGNQSEAARRLNITERRLRSRMEILGLRRPEEHNTTFRAGSSP
jgi:DNA-binding NtrC family response regulator